MLAVAENYQIFTKQTTTVGGSLVPLALPTSLRAWYHQKGEGDADVPTLISVLCSPTFLSIKELYVAVQWLEAKFFYKKKDLCSVRSKNWSNS